MPLPYRGEDDEGDGDGDDDGDIRGASSIAELMANRLPPEARPPTLKPPQTPRHTYRHNMYTTPRRTNSIISPEGEVSQRWISPGGGLTDVAMLSQQCGDASLSPSDNSKEFITKFNLPAHFISL